MPKLLILLVSSISIYASGCTTSVGTSSLYPSVAGPASSEESKENTGDTTNTGAVNPNTSTPDKTTNDDTSSQTDATDTTAEDPSSSNSETVSTPGYFTSITAKNNGESTHQLFQNGASKIIVNGVEYVSNFSSDISSNGNLRTFSQSELGNSHVKVIPAIIGEHLNNEGFSTVDDLGIFIHGEKTKEMNLPTGTVRYSGNAIIGMVPDTRRRTRNNLTEVFEPGDQYAFYATADFGPSKSFNGSIKMTEEKDGIVNSVPLIIIGRISGNKFNANIATVGRTGRLYTSGSFYGPKAEGVAGTISGNIEVNGKSEAFFGGFSGKEKTP